MLSERSMLRQTMLREMLKHLHWRNLRSNRTCDPCKTGREGRLALPAPLTLQAHTQGTAKGWVRNILDEWCGLPSMIPEGSILIMTEFKDIKTPVIFVISSAHDKEG